jgi:hypothetical protein
MYISRAAPKFPKNISSLPCSGNFFFKSVGKKLTVLHQKWPYFWQKINRFEAYSNPNFSLSQTFLEMDHV